MAQNTTLHVILSLVLTSVLNCPAIADQAEAERWMNRAMESSVGIETQSQVSHAAAQFARAYARLGDVDAALAAAKRVMNPQLKLYALKATVQAAVDSGKSTAVIVDEARKTLRGNEGAFTSSGMQQILEIVDGKQKTAAVLPVEPADESIDKLRLNFSTGSDRNEKFIAFEPLAYRLLKLKMYDELATVIEAMVEAIESNPLPEQSSKFGVYGDAAAIARVRGMHLYIALALIEEKNTAEAAKQLALVDPLIDALPEASALVKWQLQDLRIRVLLKLDRRDEAIAHLATIESAFIVSRSASVIAALQIESGDVDAGLQMAERIGDVQGSGAARGTVAIALLEHADTQPAIQYLNQLGESDDAMAGVVAIARHWVENENGDRLLSTFEFLKSPVARTHYAIAAAEFLKLSEVAPSATPL